MGKGGGESAEASDAKIRKSDLLLTAGRGVSRIQQNLFQTLKAPRLQSGFSFLTNSDFWCVNARLWPSRRLRRHFCPPLCPHVSLLMC